MIVLIIFIALTVVAICVAFVSLMCDWDCLIAPSLFTAIISLFIGIGWGFCNAVYYSCYNNEPTALDVYRGKTTLEITYRDSVAVDSVVVYKMK